MDDVVIPSSRPVISCYMPLIFSIIAIWMIIYPDSDPSLALLVPFGIRVFSAYLAARLRERASFFFLFFCFSGEPCMGNGVLSSFSIVFSANFLYPMRLFHPFSFLHKIFVITSMNRLIPPSRESPASVSQSILLFFSFPPHRPSSSLTFHSIQTHREAWVFTTRAMSGCPFLSVIIPPSPILSLSSSWRGPRLESQRAAPPHPPISPGLLCLSCLSTYLSPFLPVVLGLPKLVSCVISLGCLMFAPDLFCPRYLVLFR